MWSGMYEGRKPLGLSHIFTEDLKVNFLTSSLNDNNNYEYIVLGMYQDLFQDLYK